MYGQTSKPLTFGFGASTNTQTSAIPSFSGWTSTTTSNTALQSSVFRSAGSTSKPGGLFGASTTGVGLGGLGAFGGQSQGSLSTGFTLGGSSKYFATVNNTTSSLQLLFPLTREHIPSL